MRATLDRIQDDLLLDCLRKVIDPEIGVNIVDLGLVYAAFRRGNSLRIDLTLTSRACPLGELIVAEIRQVLAERFPETTDVEVRLVWEPAWEPDFVTTRGRQMLGF